MEKSQLIWRGIQVDIIYKPNYFSNSSKYINQLAHLEVRSNQPIPITETGYKSIFLYVYEVEEAGGAISLIEKLLNESATSKEWQEYEISQQPISLF